MKKIKFFTLITSFALIFSLQSCGGGDNPDPITPTEDTTAPVATNIIPAQNAKIEIDGNSEGLIKFSAKLTDNDKLASYSIEIHQNVEGHVDPKSISTRSVGKIPFYYAQKTFTDDVAGKKEASVSQDIQIAPINNQAIQPGSYHFVLRVTDASGNYKVYINEIILEEEA